MTDLLERYQKLSHTLVHKDCKHNGHACIFAEHINSLISGLQGDWIESFVDTSALLRRKDNEVREEFVKLAAWWYLVACSLFIIISGCAPSALYWWLLHSLCLTALESDLRGDVNGRRSTPASFAPGGFNFTRLVSVQACLFPSLLAAYERSY